MTAKQQTQNEERLDQLEEAAEDGAKVGIKHVRRLSLAIALANSHSHPEEWADRVVRAWSTGSAQDVPKEE